jgi:dUTP pyrophosphatase
MEMPVWTLHVSDIKLIKIITILSTSPVGLLFPRSSISKTDLRLANCVGVVDSGYRGEITFRYKFKKDAFFASLKRYQEGDRIGQLVIMPYPKIQLEEIGELAESERGVGGYGSTGN